MQYSSLELLSFMGSLIGFKMQIFFLTTSASGLIFGM